MTVKKYESGLTVIVEKDPSIRSVTAGIMVGTGSCFETKENNGISHFIEHMQFKGTEKRTAEDIVNAYDDAGATYNAFTGKEYTCYYFKSIDEKVDNCFDVLSDLFLHSVYEQKELDRERKVIVEEINMSLDEPDGVCYDTLYRTMYAGPLGMEILGPKENVLRFNKNDILSYKKSHYLPSNTIIAFVGNIEDVDAFRLVEKYCPELVCAKYIKPPQQIKEIFNGGYGEFIKNFEQSEIDIAFPAFPASDDKNVTLTALDNILASGMGSRLFRRVREKMGLVYSIYGQNSAGRVNGSYTISANVNKSNIQVATKAIKEEIDKFISMGVTEAECEKAKTQLKVGIIFGKENSMGYMLSLMQCKTLTGSDLDIDKRIKQIDAINPQDIQNLAKEIFSNMPAIAYAGKKLTKKVDEIYNEQ